MSSTYRQLIKSSTLYVVLGFLPMGVNFFLAPLYTEYLPPEEYALIFLTTLVQGFLSIFIGLGLEAAFSRYFFQYYKKQKLLLALLSTVLVIVIVVGVIIGVLLQIMGDPLLDVLIKNDNFSYSQYGFYGFVAAWGTVITAFFLAYYRNQERPIAFAITSLTAFALSVTGILLGVIYFEAMAYGSVVGRAAGRSFAALALIIIFWARNPFIFRWSFFRMLLVYGLPVALYLLLMAAFNNVDRIIVDQFFDEAVLGQYGFAFLMASALAVLISSIFNALVPRVFKLLTDDPLAYEGEIKNILQVFLLIILGFLVIGIALIWPFMKLFIDESYHDCIPYSGLLFMAYLPYSYYVVYTLPIFYYKKIKLLPYVSLTALIVGVSANLILIPWLGIWGVGVALFLIRSVQFGISYLLLKKYNYDKKPYLHMPKNHIISIILICVYGTLLLFEQFSDFLTIPLINVMPLLVYILMVFLFFRSQLSVMINLMKRQLASFSRK